jgi:hypothetical protein
MAQVLSNAPVETIRATLDAGADVTAVDKWTEMEITELIDVADRLDLDFLAEAVQAADSSAQDGE